MTRSRRRAQQALARDPELAEAHVSLALVQSGLDWDWDAAEQSLVRGLQRNASYVFGHQIYAGRLAFQGRLDEALEQVLLAQTLDPLGVNPARESTAGWIHWLRGEEEYARASFLSKLEFEPNDPIAHQQLGIAYCSAAEFELGIAALERATTLSPGDALITGDLAHCYARAGRPGMARALATDLERRASDSYVSPVAIAIAHVGLDDREAAFTWLERGYSLRALSMPFIAVDPRWHVLADDPRYANLVARLGLPFQARVEVNAVASPGAAAAEARSQ
jgi:tetratricopeptide (TPR) repeat protein